VGATGLLAGTSGCLAGATGLPAGVGGCLVGSPGLLAGASGCVAGANGLLTGAFGSASVLAADIPDLVAGVDELTAGAPGFIIAPTAADDLTAGTASCPVGVDNWLVALTGFSAGLVVCFLGLEKYSGSESESESESEPVRVCSMFAFKTVPVDFDVVPASTPVPVSIVALSVSFPCPFDVSYRIGSSDFAEVLSGTTVFEILVPSSTIGLSSSDFALDLPILVSFTSVSLDALVDVVVFDADSFVLVTSGSFALELFPTAFEFKSESLGSFSLTFELFTVL